MSLDKIPVLELRKSLHELVRDWCIANDRSIYEAIGAMEAEIRSLIDAVNTGVDREP